MMSRSEELCLCRRARQAEGLEREYGGAYSPNFPGNEKTEKGWVVVDVAGALAARDRRRDKWLVAFATLSILALRSGDWASRDKGDEPNGESAS
ncbi:hypothetical protein [Prosthecobacter debontii]|nr:hypothetical protein [Prosthecobacter debontii]